MPASAASGPSTRIGPTAGDVRNYHGHGPRRIGLRPRDLRDGRERGSTRYQMQELSAWKFH
jgi:hypothetical protein